jgi:transcriptional regulator with XRE-family HTH domain
VSLQRLAIAEIRAEMGRKRINQTAMARRLSEAPPWVSRRLNEEVPMTLTDLERIMGALQMPLGGFLRVALLPRLDSNQQPADSPSSQVATVTYLHPEWAAAAAQ